MVDVLSGDNEPACIISLVASGDNLRFCCDMLPGGDEAERYAAEMDGLECDTAIHIIKYGKGRACLCRLSVECTYMNIQEHFCITPMCLSKLKADVYKRDQLIQNILCKLGIN